MSESNQEMTRREWFRLRSTQTNRTLGEGVSKEEGEPNLSPIDLPPNHHGMDLAELPPMREAMLTTQQVDLLFADIQRYASEVRLFQRTHQAKARANFSSEDDLAMAKQSLQNGKVARLQIRYRWQESHWIDTLECRDDGIRLVRIAHNRLSG